MNANGSPTLDLVSPTPRSESLPGLKVSNTRKMERGGLQIYNFMGKMKDTWTKRREIDRNRDR